MKDLKILGTTCCAKSKNTYQAALEAVKQLNMHAEVAWISDIEKIMDFGVVSYPALLIDGVLATKGREINLDEMKTILSKHNTNSCGC
jgi:small redox-active disulfide protein 2